MTLPEKCLLTVFFFFSMIGNKPLKIRTITLHGNKNNFYQEFVFKCFLTPYIPHIKHMQNTLYGETD